MFCILFPCIIFSCNSNKNTDQASNSNADKSFDDFVNRFMDFYWRQNPSAAIYAGYGKYYDELKIPDNAALQSDIAFAKKYLDSLSSFSASDLSANNKIDLLILQNQLQASIWYADTFKIQEWDPSGYNIGGECYEIINQKYAPLDKRLQDLSAHIQNVQAYYTAALANIHNPTREHTELAASQNVGSLDIFGQSLTDSINASKLLPAEKDTLKQRIAATISAIKNYVASLNKMLVDKNQEFRSFRIGDKLFNQKFHYDIVTDYTAKEIYDKAMAEKEMYHQKMYLLCDELWTKYFSKEKIPVDTLQAIKIMIDKIAMQHVSPENLVDTLKNHVHEMEKFIVEKKLFNYDTAYPLKVRIMPSYISGVSLASASSAGPYDKNGTTYYNITDLSKAPVEQAESQLREYNNYTLQILSMHEAMPGHCMQGVYSNKGASIVKSVFGNGAMIEGWAVYCQKMMLENGWDNNSPEMWLMFYKWSLRECCNVLVDYGVQCLNWQKDDVVKLLTKEAFQEGAQVEEKYHRATVSQVQLCSYFTGSSEIFDLREAYKNKMGSNYSLLGFHEKFLSYGSAPVKYIRALMLGE